MSAPDEPGLTFAYSRAFIDRRIVGLLASGVCGPVLAQDFPGAHRLRTMVRAPGNTCLEGNRHAPESTPGGGAFMDDGQTVSGQLWHFVPAGT